LALANLRFVDGFIVELLQGFAGLPFCGIHLMEAKIRFFQKKGNQLLFFPIFVPLIF